ncbi:hypothetical protein NNJEOMEG_03163 [Fundidesulfovibrio magnetotacticus]|uniref:WYL domain-containing protein n=1 Tax=Fundidesulfovibrio magnetotacticus TaxID=2730080 RepID=A0A6V8LUA0_9BACT|nr:WYL domain-containing protein [Fundidesulfovibrio magnetotacticus]GFK95304.1 hypothetical protein NNJEOMEG_03163 [Fundidesulfovibrio magnetotacticus]
MPPKQDDATPGQKALALYSLLLFTGKAYTLSQLARELSCSKQTVLRLISAIEQRWNVLETGRTGRENWYRFRSPGRPPRLPVTPGQLQSLVMCRDMVSHMVPEAVREQIDGALAAAGTLLPDYGERAQAFESRVRAECKGRIDYSGHAALLESARKAIEERAVCRIRYTGVGRSEPREHLFAPLECVSYRESLYLHGLKLSDDAPSRTVGPMLLALQRLSSLEPTGQRHAHPAPAQGGSGFGIMRQEPLRAVVVFDRLAATYVRERIWSEDQELETLPDGGVRLGFTAGSAAEALSWVLSFGARARVEAPGEFQEAVRAELTAMAALYPPGA